MEQIDNDDYLLSTILDGNDTRGSNSHSNRERSSSDLSQFGVFSSNGMVKVDEESEEHKLIKIFFDLGMGTEANVVAVHKNLCSEGTTSRARLERFRSFSKAVARKHGGNANIVPAWYGSSRDEICEILLNGFSLREPTSNDEPYGVDTIHLAPLNCSFDGALCSVADDSGLRHILLCSVILGKTELVSPNSKQALPSSNKLDCGVDDPVNPRRYIIWSDFMNSHICPLYVVSFKAPPPPC
ncbi:probable inactive poly [ADP-ribose] polymerase SRO2 [Rosa rugosa]|uniref:probable inactive poly [ADP-ribose] polymerase SRO2 n=1 Tax=Rosa rugosa TaxID=74645 RepID=UPI002B403CCC|nr:probable inactive poly [ADP-ribose] polymerase SRO2 [Rosa rugosa]